MAPAPTPIETSFQSIINNAVATTLSAVSAGQTASTALASTLEEVAAKLRSGELRIDSAVTKARAQGGLADKARSGLVNDS